MGKVSGLFFLGYGVIRIFEEFFRQPDPQYGYLAFGWLTMGQILCVPMLILGAYLMFRSKAQTTTAPLRAQS
jgi:phosphatidylglycerol:prolipoprotein diacylglycerol transferase